MCVCVCVMQPNVNETHTLHTQLEYNVKGVWCVPELSCIESITQTYDVCIYITFTVIIAYLTFTLSFVHFHFDRLYENYIE